MSYMEQIAMVDAPRIAVFGIGGAGGNGVSGLIGNDLPNVRLIAANTDAQALRMLAIDQQLQLGRNSTFGLGAGARPDVGRVAAQEALPAIEAALDGVDFCFIAAGMGGGTGTGAAPIFAEAARRRGIPTIAVVTRPFEFEGGRRAAMADFGLSTLEPLVDAMVVVPNQRLLGIGHAAMTFRSAMDASNNVLADTVGSIAQLLVGPAVKRLGLAEIAYVIRGMGRAVIGFGECGIDRDRGVMAAQRAMDCPLMDDEIRGASKLMISVTGGRDLGLLELDAIVATIADRTSAEVELAWGAAVTDRDDGVVRVALIAQGQRSADPTPVPSMRPSLAGLTARSVDREPTRVPPARPFTMPTAPLAAVMTEAAASAAPIAAPEAASIAPAARVAAPATPANTPALPVAAMSSSETAPLLAYLDTLPARGTATVPADAPPITVAADAQPLNLASCTLDELWLGDFMIDDPRRLSLTDQLNQQLASAWRKLRRLYQRLTYARHSFIDFQPPVSARAG
jgi:cell division protein FtsZ